MEYEKLAAIGNDVVRQLTPDFINRYLDRKTEERLLAIESMGADAVWKRLEELEHEIPLNHASSILLRFVGRRTTVEIEAEKEALLRFLKH